MKVLHISKTNGLAGSERHLLALLPALGRAGVEVKICVAGAGNYQLFVQPLRALGIETSVLRGGPDVNPLLYGA